MKPVAEVDIAIVGGGLAGLSLAEHLADLAKPPAVLILEAAPPSIFPDHTWCFWETDDAVPSDRVSHRWPNWQVRAGDHRLRPRCPNHPYARVSAKAFLSAARDGLQRSNSTRLWNNAKATELHDEGTGVIIRLADGRHVRARWVFDTRPPTPTALPWRQVFCGYKVRSTEPLWDPTEATLMDFTEAGRSGIRFFYTLPFDASTALVEDTWLVPLGAPSPAFSPGEVRGYLAKRWGGVPVEITESERGNLPMGLPDPPATGRILPWGAAGGAIRPSSGYALTRIRRASARMAHHWARTGKPAQPLLHSPWWMRAMDRIFLRVMTRHPERMPALFASMFAQVPSDALARFLDSNPRPRDVLRLMRALPTGLFLKHALLP